MRLEECKHNQIQYLIEYPTEFDKTKRYPCIVLLHGAGSRGTDLNILKENPFFAGRNDGGRFITLAPQCYANTWFEIFEQLIDFVDTAIHTHPNVDTTRVYLMGPSMGGYATWQLAMSRPQWFAAIVPICGGGMYWNAATLKELPVWAFHGLQDESVKVEESVKMVNAVNRSGGSANLTVYPLNAHNSWSDTYGSSAVFDWLLTHKCSNYTQH